MISNPVLFVVTITTGLTCLACAPSAVDTGSQDIHRVHVEVVKQDDAWVLHRDGKPFFVKGAGGRGPFDTLAEIGGNSIRTWSKDDLSLDRPNGMTLLEDADATGLSICAGYWMEHPRHGHDYNDREFVEHQLEDLRAFVREYKQNPSILLWCIGNEVELQADIRQVFIELNRAAVEVKKIDPSRPTMVVVAEIGDRKAELFRELCPDVDILGINSYAGISSLPIRLREAGYEGPYMVTEYGVRGHWETGGTPWGAPFEQTSTEKAAFLETIYDKTIAGDPHCLGGYVFAWGWKQEVTDTWYGLFAPTGEATQRVDVLQEKWTGTAPDNRAPTVEPIADVTGKTDVNAVQPGQLIHARIFADDPDDDPLSYRWILRALPTTETVGGDFQEVPDQIEIDFHEPSPGVVIYNAPERPGEYRIQVFVTDPHNHVATANAPFRVIDAH